MALYKRGEKYPVICKLGSCKKEFIWEVKTDTDKKRECCCPRHGLELIVWHTLDEILTLSGKLPGLDVMQAADCIERALKGYNAEEISKLLKLPTDAVVFFLGHKSTIVRHGLDDRRKINGKVREEIPLKIKRQIQETFKRGDTVNGLHERFGCTVTTIKKILAEVLPAIPTEPLKKMLPDLPVVKVKSEESISSNMTLINTEDGKKFYLEF